MKNSKKFVPLKRKFVGYAHARQELLEMEEKGEIINYRISWNAQLRMTVEVMYA